jgi:preprotein translocase subunit SecY
MFGLFRQIWNAKDLRNKILIVLFLLVVYRVAAHIPLPGVNLQNLNHFFQNNQALGLLNLFSGGGLSSFSLVLMGVGPYINASIVMQLMTVVIPKLEALNKEGEAGRQKINQYTRYLTVPLAAIQSFGMIKLLESQANTSTPIIGVLNLEQLISLVVITTAGTVFLMWLGELISEKGIGNGISLIIFAGIISRLPNFATQTLSTIDQTKILGYIFFAFLAAVVILLVVLANEGQRNIPIRYAKRIRGQKTYGGMDTHLPIRLLTAGVIPIIFALSIMFIPSLVGNFFTSAKSAWVAGTARWLIQFTQNTTDYAITYFVLVIIFTFFYTSVVFKPQEVAENVQKQGGFIPGIRPGRETEQYLSRLISRVTLPGALFLGAIAVLPFVIQQLNIAPTQNLAIGGTGLLIVVSVVLDVVKQIRSQLVMRNYDLYSRR